MRCAQIVQPNEPLHVSEVDLPSVRGHQVLVKVAAAGVCHTGYSLRRCPLILFHIALTCIALYDTTRHVQTCTCGTMAMTWEATKGSGDSRPADCRSRSPPDTKYQVRPSTVYLRRN